MQTNSESVSSTSTSSQVLASKIKTSTPKVGSQLFSSNLHYQELVVRHQTIYIYYFHQSHDIAHCWLSQSEIVKMYADLRKPKTDKTKQVNVVAAKL